MSKKNSLQDMMNLMMPDEVKDFKEKGAEKEEGITSVINSERGLFQKDNIQRYEKSEDGNKSIISNAEIGKVFPPEKHAGGRPKVYDEKMYSLNMKIEESINEKLVEMCKRTGLQKTMIVKRALLDYYNNHMV